MMEEVSDDTNGESTFEFVGGKIDESVTKDNILTQPITSADTPITGVDSAHSYSVPMQLTPISVAGTTLSNPSNITFYDPSQQLNSKNVVLPPLAPPPVATPFIQSDNPTAPQPYIPLQSSYLPADPPSQSFQPPASVPDSYPQTNVHHGDLALPLPLDMAGEPLHQDSGESGVWGWLKGKDFLHKVAEKAKSSVDSVITTLDPGMKEIINSGGDINVIVASGNEMKISAVREAFQQVFGKATVQGVPIQSSSIAPQPVGFSAGLKAAEERISNLRQQAFIDDKHIIVAIENFLAELTPDNWFDIGCLLLQDFSSTISLQVYTQAVPVSSHFVTQAKEKTPSDYPLGWSGFSVTIGQLVGPAFGVQHSEWHQALTSVSRRDMVFIAAKTIAGMYKMQTMQ